ncbi:hypothetical protein [Halomonas salipaludis]|uniref:hypothetical protein n=1 Tax=Halomonas salipaludis TaxID=2032625 RepID=UPI001140A4C7|nr:hypothetical protein [Halomonas salipaludis]
MPDIGNADNKTSALDKECSQPEAVMLCNTSLHVLNALEACEKFKIEHGNVWIVITMPPLTNPENIYPILKQGNWGRVIWIDDRPRISRGWRFFLGLWYQYKYHRKWQSQLVSSKKVRRIFCPLNRLVMNRFVVNWLKPRQVIWYDDGTLSYVLARQMAFSSKKQ